MEEEDLFVADNVLHYHGKVLKNGIWKKFTQQRTDKTFEFPLILTFALVQLGQFAPVKLAPIVQLDLFCLKYSDKLCYHTDIQL